VAPKFAKRAATRYSSLMTTDNRATVGPGRDCRSVSARERLVGLLGVVLRRNRLENGHQSERSASPADDSLRLTYAKSFEESSGNTSGIQCTNIRKSVIHYLRKTCAVPLTLFLFARAKIIPSSRRPLCGGSSAGSWLSTKADAVVKAAHMVMRPGNVPKPLLAPMDYARQARAWPTDCKTRTKKHPPTYRAAAKHSRHVDLAPKRWPLSGPRCPKLTEHSKEGFQETTSRRNTSSPAPK
jgi:hypothetical protein